MIGRPRETLRNLGVACPSVIAPTGVRDLDVFLDGGLRSGEVLLVIGNDGASDSSQFVSRMDSVNSEQGHTIAPDPFIYRTSLEEDILIIPASSAQGLRQLKQTAVQAGMVVVTYLDLLYSEALQRQLIDDEVEMIKAADIVIRILPEDCRDSLPRDVLVFPSQHGKYKYVFTKARGKQFLHAYNALFTEVSR